MSGSETKIVCRSCNEVIPQSGGSCPHCGSSIRASTGPVAAIAIGLVIAIASLFSIGDLWFFGLVGVIIALVGGMLFLDKRRRIQEAYE